MPCLLSVLKYVLILLNQKRIMSDQTEFEEARIPDSEELHASKFEDGSTRTVVLWVVACIVVVSTIIIVALYS